MPYGDCCDRAAVVAAADDDDLYLSCDENDRLSLVIDCLGIFYCRMTCFLVCLRRRRRSADVYGDFLLFDSCYHSIDFLMCCSMFVLLVG